MSGFEHHFVRFTKAIAMIAITATGACVMLLLGVQFVRWVQYREWKTYPASSFLASRGDTYSVASSITVDTDQPDAHSMIGWVLELPATVLLLIVLAALVGFWTALLQIEKAWQQKYSVWR